MRIRSNRINRARRAESKLAADAAPETGSGTEPRPGPPRWLRRIALLLFYLLALTLAGAIVYNTSTAAERYRALVAFDSAEERTDTLVRGWLEDLSLGMYSGSSDKARAIAALRDDADFRAMRGTQYAVLLVVLCAAFLAMRGFALRGAGPRRPRMQSLLHHVFAVAGIFLVVGLLAPLLTVSVYRDVAVLGRVVLQYDTKGILTTVAKLWITGNWMIAALLGLFSVVMPGAKLLLSWLALAEGRPRLRRGALRLVTAIGRWSMTDVFVVAVLLAFLAASAEQLTDATLGAGLYFFAAYALLSIAGGHALVAHSGAAVPRL